MPQPLKIDHKQAQRFIEILHGSKDVRVTFQTFDDNKTKGAKRRNDLTRIIHGSFVEVEEQLNALQRKGAGVYLMINEGDLKGRREGNVQKVLCYFYDEDKGIRPNPPIKPTVIIASKNGKSHGYFKVQGHASLESFSEIQKSISSALSTDPSVSDLSRVMRLPGSYHLKDPNNPFLVVIDEENLVAYTEGEVVNAFAGQKQPKAAEIDLRSRSSVNESPTKSTTDAVRNYLFEKGIYKNPRSIDWFGLLQKAEYEHEDASDRGGKKISLRCPNWEQHSPHDSLDGSTKLLLNPRRLAGFKCFHSKCAYVGVLELIKLFPLELIDEFASEAAEGLFERLAREYLEAYKKPVVKHYGDFYEYSGSNYEPIVPQWFDDQLAKFLQKRLRQNSKLAKSVHELRVNLSALTSVAPQKIPFWLESSNAVVGRVIPLRTGLFLLDKYIKYPGSMDVVIPHSPDYFCLNALTFDYDPTASAPIWNRFLMEMIPDPELRDQLQEFVGLCLINDTTFNKMLFLVGDGANGKSVILTVVRCLIGQANVSAVGLEAFSPTRTFPLAQTVGKLVNIIPELGEINRAEEGVIKAFTSGELITVEKKHRDPIEIVPTARLICGTNNMPHFRDKTDGIFRRILLIPMTVQITDESKQDKRLIDANFWDNSGEIPGVFNWALTGLTRLLERGHFKEASASIEAKSKYRTDLNPAQSFLREHIMASNEVHEILAKDLYEAYSSWCTAAGYKPQNESNFCSEVKRTFPGVKYSDHAQTRNRMIGSRKYRGRVWAGLIPIERIVFLDFLKEVCDS